MEFDGLSSFVEFKDINLIVICTKLYFKSTNKLMD